VFPSLLKKLMAEDFESAIRSGFEHTGIYPVNPERVLSKLPKEQREADSDVQQQFLNRLSTMRYSPGLNTKAPRPKKKDKLPAGASYTCTPVGAVVALPDNNDAESPAGVPAPTAPKRARQLQPEGDASSRDGSSSHESDRESTSDNCENSSSENEDSSSDGDKCDSKVSKREELCIGIRAIVQRRKKKMVEKEETQERKKKKMQEEDRQKTEEGERPRKKD
jgi:hypothetical protein